MVQAARLGEDDKLKDLLDDMRERMKKEEEQEEENEKTNKNIINIAGPRGVTAAHWAALTGRLDMLERLSGAEKFDVGDDLGRSPLFYATHARNATEVVETPLYFAALWLKPEVIAMLIRRDNETLVEAVRKCTRQDKASSFSVKVVERLVKGEVDNNACGSNERKGTILHLAATKGCKAVIDILKRYECYKELARHAVANNFTPLHAAAQAGWADVAEVLLDHFNADLEARTNQNRTALHLAASSGHTDLVTLLIYKGCDIMARTQHDYTPADLACIDGHDEAGLCLLKEMWKMSASEVFEVHNAEGQSLLRIAANAGCTKVVKCIIEYAYTNESFRKTLFEQKDGCTVAYDAIYNNHICIAMTLMEKGVSTEGLDDNENTALHWAATHGATRVVEKILKAGDRATPKNKQRETPIDQAARGLHDETVALFLRHHEPEHVHGEVVSGWSALHWADVSAKDKSGRTAADIAMKAPNCPIEILELLKYTAFYVMDDPVPTLERPQRPVSASATEEACKRACAYLMDAYTQCAVEKLGFSVYNITYENGPQNITTAAAKAEPVDDTLMFRWIHLPANNVNTMGEAGVHPDYSDLASLFENTSFVDDGPAGESPEVLTAESKLPKEEETTRFSLQNQSTQSTEAPPGSVDGVEKRGDLAEAPTVEETPMEKEKARQHHILQDIIGNCLLQSSGQLQPRLLQSFFENSSDASILDLQSVIRDHFIKDKDQRPKVLSTIAMAYLILAACCRRSIDCELCEDKQNLLQVFGSAVARTADHEVKLFDQFINDLDKGHGKTPQPKMRKSRDLSEETNLLKVVKDIQDELNIIKTVLLGQKKVLDATRNILHTGNKDFAVFYDALSKIDVTHQAVDKLIHDAQRTQDNINHLLDLRQKEANLSEAIWARKASEDTTLQGRTIMVFTVVTIVFLPITFLTSLFALDISSFPHDNTGNLKYRADWVFPMIFCITIAVSVPLIAVAFFVNEVSDFFASLWKGNRKQTVSKDGIKAARSRDGNPGNELNGMGKNSMDGKTTGCMTLCQLLRKRHGRKVDASHA
ncbi:putative KRR-R motif-containing protein 1 [Seiridium cardinale]